MYKMCDVKVNFNHKNIDDTNFIALILFHFLFNLLEVFKTNKNDFLLLPVQLGD